LLAKRIVARLAAIPHRTYVEPFVGMGGVFLRRPWRA
jgi:DNA adenine methylase